MNIFFFADCAHIGATASPTLGRQRHVCVTTAKNGLN
jgi:hypothetical protein